MGPSGNLGECGSLCGRGVHMRRFMDRIELSNVRLSRSARDEAPRRNHHGDPGQPEDTQ
ncbi:hypothetical protein AKJ08_0579 [Vulgatibacter incomptus]|uniref:Uncharacterized protein n=1 Tax=Vulgatibacter incomptus TaxID=1391653 RepID=A0A0K1P9K2_9BACT|nr:hypothetical protein AKJ08_0579 [Vulgatibacter incomptus]